MSEVPLEQQRHATLDVLTAYSNETWLPYRARNERSGGLDSKLALEYGVVNNHMNYLLERYFTLIAGVELESINHVPVEVKPHNVDVQIYSD